MKSLIKALKPAAPLAFLALLTLLTCSFTACIPDASNQDVPITNTTPDPFTNCVSKVGVAPGPGQLCCPNLTEKGGVCQQGDCIGVGNLCANSGDCCGTGVCTDIGNGNKICR